MKSRDWGEVQEIASRRLQYTRRKCYSASMKLTDLTTEQRKRVADLAGSTDDSLRHIQRGRQPVSARLAIAIEKAAKKVGLDVRRESLCAACGGCDLAKKARKVVAK